MNLQNANAGVAPKLGYVPQSFPRDIIKINQFAEHVLLAQILEPLVDADRFGNMTRGIAERWSVSQDGKTIVFFIEKGQLFSNGNPALRAARSAGIAVVGKLPGLRRAFMRQAAGIAGNPPRPVGTTGQHPTA